MGKKKTLDGCDGNVKKKSFQMFNIESFKKKKFAEIIQTGLEISVL